MRGIFYPATTKANQFPNSPINSVTNSFSLTQQNGGYTDKKNPQINRSIEKGLAQLVKNNLGLQAVLRSEQSIIIDRMIFSEVSDEKKPCNDNETCSSRSETNSTRTHASSTDNSSKSKRSTTDLPAMATTGYEDITQRYYKELKNSLNNCVLTKKPGVWFNDIAGNSYAKQIIREGFILPLLYPKAFNGNGQPKPWKKLLIYGPPGVGKTMLAQAVATEIDATCFWVSLADLTSKFIGESEKLLRMLFEVAREKAPSIIIIDEMDSLGRKRNGSESETERRIKTEFLRQMDEINNSDEMVFVLATTNMPWELDIAALRRFERRVLLPMPDLKAREEIFRLHIGLDQKLSDSDYKCLAQLTEGYSGSDISTVVNDAFMKPVRCLDTATHFKLVKKPRHGEIDGIIDQVESKGYYEPCDPVEEDAINKSLLKIHSKRIMLKDVTMQDFKDSIKNCKRTVHQTFLELYNKFLLKYGHIEQKDDLAPVLSSTKTGYFL